ncbi:hypothetical protein B0A55_06324 [Friedmanniomyces simplex]|uniref:Thioesterase domain-containing protein n=1 Tax=Friedmanniomyces simplex TaxID=329884 RepID=A0A4V5NFG9_9PEZI|nr:hypothetical protein B0A55_06324 [Friedmanniomyces simplex]
MAALPHPETNEQARDLITRFIRGYAAAIPPTNFDQPFYTACVCTAATLETPSQPATATFRILIPPTYVNNPDPANPTIHGGAIAHWFDSCTSMPLLCVRKVWDESWSGVSRNLNVTYLRPPREGEAIVIETEVVQCGKRIATIRGVMRRERDGAILATCQHDKARPDRGHVPVKL